ncbi:hypothetical protein FNB15_03005 [Ferrovibrio terrae]|uniref:D-isomer specific 2-hydroxyacid dehydrogenase NAD-binding domain-containing protein n=1 Tax=Ferrovibrio terrae TaxID=2594003 RepID=A0A516GXT2_9PROT|nr:NAD(P)-dependent oxidoreductase [Ferrovibrio terrae]QDO96307.1 hypothetical protein FNB15_03005 [Ferrovibrio terrae]
MENQPKLLITEPDGFPADAEARLSEHFLVQKLASADALADAAADAVGLLIRLHHRIDADLLARTTQLRFVATSTTGLTHIDLEAAQRRDIAILSLKGEEAFLRSIHSTAELAWGLAISLMRHIPPAAASVNRGEWDRYRFLGREMRGRRLGIVGYGRLGEIMGRYGLAFGMSVWANDIRDQPLPDGIERKTLADIFASCDIISIHLPATGETRGLIGKDLLGRMLPDAILINTARGDVVDEAALAHLIEQRRIGGVGLDVLNEETGGQQEASRRLRAQAEAGYPVLITPHIGGATDAMPRAEAFMADKAIAWWRSAQNMVGG